MRGRGNFLMNLSWGPRGKFLTLHWMLAWIIPPLFPGSLEVGGNSPTIPREPWSRGVTIDLRASLDLIYLRTALFKPRKIILKLNTVYCLLVWYSLCVWFAGRYSEQSWNKTQRGQTADCEHGGQRAQRKSRKFCQATHLHIWQL